MTQTEQKVTRRDARQYEFSALDLTLEDVCFDDKGFLLSGHVVDEDFDLIIFEGEWGAFRAGAMYDFENRSLEGKRIYFDERNINRGPISDWQRVAQLIEPNASKLHEHTDEEDPVRHRGVHAHRLNPDAGNDLEVRFAEEWDRMQENSAVLRYLLSTRGMPDEVDPRDAEVAATVIQWLGSPVGSSFVRGVLERYDDEMTAKSEERRQKHRP